MLLAVSPVPFAPALTANKAPIRVRRTNSGPEIWGKVARRS